MLSLKVIVNRIVLINYRKYQELKDIRHNIIECIVIIHNKKHNILEYIVTCLEIDLLYFLIDIFFYLIN
jgi:hypothetical protein